MQLFNRPTVVESVLPTLFDIHECDPLAFSGARTLVPSLHTDGTKPSTTKHCWYHNSAHSTDRLTYISALAEWHRAPIYACIP